MSRLLFRQGEGEEREANKHLWVAQHKQEGYMELSCLFLALGLQLFVTLVLIIWLFQQRAVILSAEDWYKFVSLTQRAVWESEAGKDEAGTVQLTPRAW